MKARTDTRGPTATYDLANLNNALYGGLLAYLTGWVLALIAKNRERLGGLWVEWIHHNDVGEERSATCIDEATRASAPLMITKDRQWSGIANLRFPSFPLYALVVRIEWHYLRVLNDTSFCFLSVETPQYILKNIETNAETSALFHATLPPNNTTSGETASALFRDLVGLYHRLRVKDYVAMVNAAHYMDAEITKKQVASFRTALWLESEVRRRVQAKTQQAPPSALGVAREDEPVAVALEADDLDCGEFDKTLAIVNGSCADAVKHGWSHAVLNDLLEQRLQAATSGQFDGEHVATAMAESNNTCSQKHDGEYDGGGRSNGGDLSEGSVRARQPLRERKRGAPSHLPGAPGRKQGQS